MHQSVVVQHAGIFEGHQGTTRLGIWFDPEPTPRLLKLLEGVSQSIEGGVMVITSNRQHVRAEVVFAADVIDIESAAGAFIRRANEVLGTLPEEALNQMLDREPVKEALAVNSRTHAD